MQSLVVEIDSGNSGMGMRQFKRDKYQESETVNSYITDKVIINRGPLTSQALKRSSRKLYSPALRAK